MCFAPKVRTNNPLARIMRLLFQADESPTEVAIA